MAGAELKGQVFGRLTVLRYSHTDNNQKRVWLCQCQCGKRTKVITSHLKSGATLSCGCYNRGAATERATKHGKANSRTYDIWCNMRARCDNPHATGYARYGGRGITVCKRWEVFENFLADMGECPAGLTLERTDSNGNYTPKNCVWATRKTQSANRPTFVHQLKWKGKTWTLTDLAAHYGLTFSTAKRRLNLGWSLKKTLETPVR